MNGAVIIEIGAVAIDRLLEISHHAEVAGPRRSARWIFQPASGGGGRTRDFGQDGKLGGIGVLRFIENDAEVFFADAAGRGGVLHQFVGQRDLIGIGHHAALQPEIAIVALHFRCHTKGGFRYPTAERRKRVAPTLEEFARAARSHRPPHEFPAGQETFFPVSQLGLGIGDRFLGTGRRHGGVHLGEIKARAGTDAAGGREDGARVARQLHQLSGRRQAKEGSAVFRIQTVADMGVLLNEFFPELIVVCDQLERCRQTEIMPVAGEQAHAEAVDRPEKGAIESSLDFGRPLFFENALPGALLHFVGSPVRERDHDKSRQDLEGAGRASDLHHSLGDRMRLAGARGSDDREIAVEFFGETAPLGMIVRQVHQKMSSSSRTSAGWVRSHRCSRMSGSIASVASG